MKPPVPYLGAKVVTADRIARLLPPHKHYVEPFAGALGVLLAKPPSQAETVSDIDGDLIAFWRALRDHPEALIRACALTPHARDEYYASIADLDGLDDIERARRVWVRITQGSSRTLRHGGMWAKYLAASVPSQIAPYRDRLAATAERLSTVSIESRTAEDMITKYGRHPDVLLYLDPPYLDDTRNRYRHEYSTADHERLLAQIVNVPAAVAISGYPSPLYDTALHAWERHEFHVRAGGRGTRNVPRTEVLWIKNGATT